MTIDKICLIIILIAGISIMYKIFLHRRLVSDSDKNKLSLFIPKIENFLFFFVNFSKREAPKRFANY